MTKVYVVESFYGDNWDNHTEVERVFTDLETAVEWSEEQYTVPTDTLREYFIEDGIVAVVTEKEVDRCADWTSFTIYERELIGG